MSAENGQPRQSVSRHWPFAVAALLGIGVAQDGFSLQTLVGLGLLGVVLGMFRKANPLLLGLSTVVLLPVTSAVEMLGDPTSHNVWPLEWFAYGLMSVPGICGASIGHVLAGALARKPSSEGH